MHFLIHDILISQVLLGFISYMILREWLFPKVRDWMLGETKIFQRKAAILLHYRLRAQGAGHDNKSVVACEQGRCITL